MPTIFRESVTSQFLPSLADVIEACGGRVIGVTSPPGRFYNEQWRVWAFLTDAQLDRLNAAEKFLAAGGNPRFVLDGTFESRPPGNAGENAAKREKAHARS